MRLKEFSVWMVDAPQDCAWSRRKLLGLRNLVRDKMTIQLGDGRQCSLFYDIWLGKTRLGGRFPVITEELLAVNATSEPDNPVWKCSTSGNFDIRSCYEEIRRKKPRVTWDRMVWNATNLPGHSFILWLALKGENENKAILDLTGSEYFR